MNFLVYIGAFVGGGLVATTLWWGAAKRAYDEGVVVGRKEVWQTKKATVVGTPRSFRNV